MTGYAVIYERGERGWGAWVPDLPGCVAAGQTRIEVEDLIREAISLHIAQMRARGESIPKPSALETGLIEVA